MNSIDTRPPFFPNSKSNDRSIDQLKRSQFLKRNSYDRAQEIQSRTGQDAKVNIPDAVKDFSRIKKTADMAPPIDNSAKIARLKAQIQAGTYQADYEAVADKMLASEY